MSARLAWVVEQLRLEPHHLVLEVGCGHGIAATYVLERLVTGTYVGVDRSPAMVAASKRRHRAAIASGSAHFVRGTFADANIGRRAFDRIFAARVADMSEGHALQKAVELLDAGGEILLAFDAPGGKDAQPFVDHARDNLRRAGFTRLQHSHEVIDGSDVRCVRARPAM